MMSLTNLKPKIKIFFISGTETCQILKGLEQLFSTIVSGNIPTQKRVQTARF